MSRVTLRAGALAVACLCAACGTVDPGFAVVTQDKYDFMPCKEIISYRTTLTGREKDLSELAAKAETGPGGIVVSTMAYGSELASVRTQIVAVNRAAQKNNCDAGKKP